jgi:hypothetical protein
MKLERNREINEEGKQENVKETVGNKNEVRKKQGDK